MRKKEFLTKLRQNLRGIPSEEIHDILYDFEEYFNGGIQDGRSEEELADSLGNPKNIAKQVRAEFMVQLAKDAPSIRNMLNAIFATIGPGFFQVIGLSFIAIGVMIFLNQLSIVDFSWGYLWPIFVLAPGVAFEASYFTNPMRGKTNLSLLIPGGILTISGVLLFHGVYTDFVYLARLWPIFVLAIAFGLFQFYFFGSKNEWFLLPVGVLGAIGSIFLVRNLVSSQTFGYFLGLLLIILGLLMGFTIQKRFKE